MKKISKKAKSSNYADTEEKLSQVNEPVLEMRSIKKLQGAVADYAYKKFQKIADTVPFTQAEWASILHLSDRTLQRYAKDNKSFEGIYVDRILHIEKLIELGLQTFSSANAFYEWLQKSKEINGYELDFNSLSHSQGIQELYDQLGRIQHGVY